jgi:predicted deacylase
MLTTLAPQLWRFSGKGGMRIGILAGMHGDEPAAIRLIHELAHSDHPFWKDCPHEVLFGIGNPAAVAIEKRAGPDGVDLNRAFSTHSHPRARVLCDAFQGVDSVLDLHQTHLPISPCAVCADHPESLRLAAQLGATQAVTGTEALYENGLFTDWVTRQGGIGITLETGQVGDPKAYATAKEAVRRLLLPTAARPQSTEILVWKMLQPLYAPAGAYQFAREFHNGSRVKKGELIAKGENSDVYALADGALFLPKLGQTQDQPCCVQMVAVD